MSGFLGRVLNVRPNEWRRFSVSASLMFLFILGYTWVSISIPAGFAAEIGVDTFPQLFITEALAGIILMLIYTAFADRYPHARLMIVLSAIAVVAILIGWGLLSAGYGRVAYLYLNIVFKMVADVVGLHLFTYLFSFYDTQAAKRIVPLLFSVYRVAAIIGGFTLPVVNSLIGTSNIYILWAVAVAGIGIIVMLTPRLLPDVAKAAVKTTESEPQPSFIENIVEGFRFIFQSNFLRMMAIASLLMIASYTLMRFQSYRVFESNLQTEAEISSFVGILSGIGSLLILPVQLFLYGRIVARIGIGNTNLIYPLMTAGISALVIGFPNQLWAGALAYINFSVLNIAFRAITDDLLYNAVPTRVQGRARAMIAGVIVPVGMLVTGLIALLPITDEFWFLPVMLGGTAVFYVIAAFFVRKLYGWALITLLQSQSSLVLSSANFNLNDPATVNYLKTKLKDSTNADEIVITARLIAEGLGKDAVPILEPYVRTGDAEVRAAVLDTLVSCDVHGEAARRLFFEAMTDPDTRVRRVALNGLEIAAGYHDADFLALAARLLEDTDTSEAALDLQAQALAVLLRSRDAASKAAVDAALNRFLESEDANRRAMGLNSLMEAANLNYLPLLLKYLNDPSDTVRIAAATAIESLAMITPDKGAISAHLSALEAMLNDPVERVRLAGLRVFVELDPKAHLPHLIHALTDSSRGVRSEASNIIVRMGKRVVPVLKTHLETRNALKRRMVMYTLSKIDRDDYLSGMYEQIRANIHAIYENHARLAALEPQSQYTGVSILQTAIRDRNQELAEEIFYLLTALHPADSVKVVRNSLGSDTSTTRANAVEALETMLPPTMVPPIAALFDPAQPDLLKIGRDEFDIEAIPSDTIFRTLLNDENAWFRAITAFALGEIGAALKPAQAAPRPNGGASRGGRRRSALDLLGAIGDTPAPAEEPKAAEKSNGLFTLEQIQDMLQSREADPVEDVRTAVAAARRVLQGSNIIEAARKEGKVLSAIEKVIFLKGVPFFQGMTVDQLKVLSNVCEEELFPDTTVIFEEGDPGGTLYVIVSGRVAIERGSRVARTTARLNTLEARSYFGEATLFDNSPCTTMALALEDTLTLRLRYEHLVALMQEYPELSLHLIKVLSKRLQETSEQVASLTRSMSRSMHQVYDKLD